MVDNHIIPHLEPLMCGSEGLGHGRHFTLGHALIKMGVLYEKHAIVRFDLNTAVFAMTVCY